MYEYVIPQEFNQSDRIGNYTIPQAMILGFGIIVAALLLASGWMSYWISVPLSIIIMIITFYFMSKKINGIPLYEFILVYAVYRTSPKLIIYKLDNSRENFRVDEEDDSIANSIFVDEESEEESREKEGGKKKEKKNKKVQKSKTKQVKNVKQKEIPTKASSKKIVDKKGGKQKAVSGKTTKKPVRKENKNRR